MEDMRFEVFRGRDWSREKGEGKWPPRSKLSRGGPVPGKNVLGMVSPTRRNIFGVGVGWDEELECCDRVHAREEGD